MKNIIMILLLLVSGSLFCQETKLSVDLATRLSELRAVADVYQNVENSNASLSSVVILDKSDRVRTSQIYDRLYAVLEEVKNTKNIYSISYSVSGTDFFMQVTSLEIQEYKAIEDSKKKIEYLRLLVSKSQGLDSVNVQLLKK